MSPFTKTDPLWIAIVIIAILTGCLGGNKTLRSENKDFPLYWAGENVGTGNFNIDVIKLSSTDYVPFTTIRENISYLGANYIFEFTLADKELSKLTVLRYNPEKDVYISGDSYTLKIEDNILQRRYYEKNGKEILQEQDIQDVRRIEYTRELFRSIADKLRSYYGYYIYSNSEFSEYEKIKSVGYELLNYRKI